MRDLIANSPLEVRYFKAQPSKQKDPFDRDQTKEPKVIKRNRFEKDGVPEDWPFVAGHEFLGLEFGVSDARETGGAPKGELNPNYKQQ